MWCRSRTFHGKGQRRLALASSAYRKLFYQQTSAAIDVVTAPGAVTVAVPNTILVARFVSIIQEPSLHRGALQRHVFFRHNRDVAVALGLV